MPTALITGATSGLGAEFARQLAGQGHDLVIVARDKARLEQSAEQIRDRAGVEVEVLPADLADPEQCREVERRLADADRPVEMLVNNAGFGLATYFHRSSADDEERMLDVLVRAPVRLTHAAVTAMVPRGSGSVVNVASVAGFLPGGTYGAAKAYMIAFSRSIAARLRRKGVRVMVLCPGYTHTEFHQRAEIDKTQVPGWMWLTAEGVVEHGLHDLRRGVVVSIPGRQYQAIVQALRLAPPRLVSRIAGRRAV
jgi:uncharacterized protein